MARKFGANCSKCQRSTEQQQSIKCFKIHSKDLLQNNDFHITSSIFLLSSVLVFLFLLNFIFQFHRLSFLYCPNFWRFARIFSRLGGLPPPPPAPPARTPMEISCASLLWYSKHSFPIPPIPPVDVRIRGVKAPCSMSKTLLEYRRFFPFS